MKRRPSTKSAIRETLPYYPRGRLLSQGEAVFFSVLKRALAGRYLIAPKVRAADLLHCSTKAWEAGFGHYVSRHHLDFVLCDQRTTEVLAAIELDDKSHSQKQRRDRDEFLNRAFCDAALPLIRFRAAARYDQQLIAEIIEQSLRS